MKIFTINNKKEEKFLRKKTADFGFNKLGKKEISELSGTMRGIMIEARGIGLSANQLGLNLKFFVAQISDKPLKRDENNKVIMAPPELMKFYAIFNPEIIKFSEEKIVMEEGCLSVPGIYGLVERPVRITLVGRNENDKKIKIKTSGILARVFQHEFDDLNGILFIDKAEKLHKIE